MTFNLQYTWKKKQMSRVKKLISLKTGCLWILKFWGKYETFFSLSHQILKTYLYKNTFYIKNNYYISFQLLCLDYFDLINTYYDGVIQFIQTLYMKNTENYVKKKLFVTNKTTFTHTA